MTSWKITEPDRLEIADEVRRLDVNLLAGRLNVVGTDGPARVEISQVSENTPVDVSVDAGLLSVSHPMPQAWPGLLKPLWWWLNGHRMARSDVSIALPYGAAAVLRVTSGSAIASGIHGNLTVDVVSGRITLLGNEGRIYSKIISGPIEALGCAGDITVETVSGEITIAESATERVHAKTVSGSLTADLDNPPRNSDIYLETISGEITIRVREDSDLTVSLAATGGRVTSAFPGLGVGDGKPWGKRLTGVLGAGTGRLHASAVSGEISLLPRPVDDGFDAGSDDGTDEGGAR
jgi:hypothetical protein